MKQFLLILIMLPTLLMGCAKNNSILNERDGDGAINFSPNSYIADVTQYEWANNDAVGVFMLPKNVSVANGGDADKRNKKYLYNDLSDEFKADGAANQLNFNGIDWVKFVAYRPFVDNIDNVAKDYVYPINVGVQTTDYKDIDFIYSNTGRLYSKIGGAIELEFRHMLSKLVLRFESAVSATLASLDEIYLKNMATTVNFDMKDETFKGWGNYAGSSIKAVSEITQASDVGARVFEVIVTPTPVGGWSLSERLIEHKTSIVKEKSLAVSDEYESGMMYLYNINLDEVKNEMEIQYVEVVEWGDGEAFGLDADITAFFRDPVFRQYVKDEFCGRRSKILKSDLVNVAGVILDSWTFPDLRSISTLAGIEYLPKLTNLHADFLSLKNLNVSRNLALKSLNCNNNPLTSLDVSRNVALTSLKCVENALTILDVSSNVALMELNCSYNSLISLDVSSNVALMELNCSGNPLPSLDVSGAEALTTLECNYNSLTHLDVSTNTALTTLVCYYNPLLISLDVSGATALTTLECRNNSLGSLGVSTNTALTSLQCYSNPLTRLDVSNNTALTYLNCHSNLLTRLDVSKNTALTWLGCSSNLLTRLDVSNNTALMDLNCHSNQLTSLDVSGFVALTTLDCGNNSLGSLDVSRHTKLMTLECGNNSLGSLDVSNNTALTDLGCSSNQLTSLDLSAHTILTKFTLIKFDLNPGNGTTMGFPHPADFEVKLPSGTNLNKLPIDFPQRGSDFKWDYRFSVGPSFEVITLYTNL